MTETTELTCPFPTCGYTSSRSTALQSHIKTRHEIHPETEITIEKEQNQDGEGKVMRCWEAPLECDKCSYQTPSGILMRMHTRIHSYENSFKYQNLGCNYRGRWAQNLQKHLGSCRPGRQAKSSQETTFTEKNIKEGSRLDLTETETKMEFPGAAAAAETLGKNSIPSTYKTTAEGSAEVYMGRARMEKDVLYYCTICRYTSKWRPNVRRHLKVHKDRKPLSYPINGSCSYQAKRSQSPDIDLPSKQPVKILDTLGSDKGWKNNTEVTVQSSSSSNTAFACMLCEFIGDSVLSALKHAHQHKTVAISKQ